MYQFQFGPVTYGTWKGGRPITLVEAMRETYGVGSARILRLDGTPVVLNAGSSVQITHAPTGRVIGRRRARHHR